MSNPTSERQSGDPGVRRNCDYCVLKKVKCQIKCSGGVCCSMCSRKGLKCVYSEKRKPGPKSRKHDWVRSPITASYGLSMPISSKQAFPSGKGKPKQMLRKRRKYALHKGRRTATPHQGSDQLEMAAQAGIYRAIDDSLTGACLSSASERKGPTRGTDSCSDQGTTKKDKGGLPSKIVPFRLPEPYPVFHHVSRGDHTSHISRLNIFAPMMATGHGEEDFASERQRSSNEDAGPCLNGVSTWLGSPGILGGRGQGNRFTPKPAQQGMGRGGDVWMCSITPQW